MLHVVRFVARFVYGAKLVEMIEHFRHTPMNILLIGFMGSGKTTIANRLANNLGFEFIDTDELIEKNASKSINEIFTDEGESEFRKLESQVLGELEGRERMVIATGGGIVSSDDNIKRLRKIGIVFWLDAGVDSILERVSRNSDRPLLKTNDPRKTILALLDQRHKNYSECSDERMPTDGLSIEEVSFGISETARLWFAKRV
tara:strand:- start:850 stop:1455 length:606 start_codon:yes stop_codon:yes gene_type:complete